MKTSFRPYIRSASVLLTFLILIPALSSAGQYKVLRVVDGDTIEINYNGKKECVRLLCVNTPESVHPDKKQNIPMGKTASAYTKSRLNGKYVDLEFEGKRRGKYKRLLAYVLVDGQNFNLELVRKGLSPYYTKYGLSRNYDAEFRAAEKLARKEKLHIWGDPELTEKYLRLKSKWGQKRSSIQTDSYNTSVVAEAGYYIGNKRSHKFHRPNCRWAKRMSRENVVVLQSRQDAHKQGYVPCKVCKP